MFQFIYKTAQVCLIIVSSDMNFPLSYHLMLNISYWNNLYSGSQFFYNITQYSMSPCNDNDNVYEDFKFNNWTTAIHRNRHEFIIAVNPLL